MKVKLGKGSAEGGVATGTEMREEPLLALRQVESVEAALAAKVKLGRRRRLDGGGLALRQLAATEKLGRRRRLDGGGSK